MSLGRTRLAINVFAAFVVFMSFTSLSWVDVIGPWAYGTLAAAIVIGCIALTLRVKPDLRWWKAPKAVGLLVAAELVLVLWVTNGIEQAAFQLAAIIGVTMVGVFFAVCLNWSELLGALDAGMRWVIGLSLLWELIVAVFVRQQVPSPFPGTLLEQPGSLSDANLFSGGPVQGVVGYELLGVVALLGIIVWGIRLASNPTHRFWLIVWIILAAAVLALTRSPASLAAAVFVALVLLLALWARDSGPAGRKPVYFTAAGLIAAGIVIAIVFSAQLAKIFAPGGRLALGETDTVPATGGWPGLWQELNVVVIILLAAVFASTLWRSWFHAIDRPRCSVRDEQPYRASALLSLLVVALLLSESFTGSLLLAEAGSILLIAFATKTKLDSTG